MDKSCDHIWSYQGAVYSEGSQCPGSGAYDRIYEDRYFCTKCLAVKDMNKRIWGNTYQQPFDNSMPK